MLGGFIAAFRRKKIVVIISLIVMMISLYSFKFLATEFLPELNEWSIWLWVQIPYSVSLNKSVEVSTQVRQILMTFPQVKHAVSQTGRPDDGTDVAGFYNNEFSVMHHKLVLLSVIFIMLSIKNHVPPVIYFDNIKMEFLKKFI